MGVDMETIVTVIGSMGGIEGIKWGIRSWLNRETDARKEDASADGMEIQNLLSVISSLTMQLENSDRRVKERDAKVDYLYGELLREQTEKLDLIRESHGLELSEREAEMRRCDVRGCPNRIPPSDY